jgi:hypothetical protein
MFVYCCSLAHSKPSIRAAMSTQTLLPWAEPPAVGAVTCTWVKSPSDQSESGDEAHAPEICVVDDEFENELEAASTMEEMTGVLEKYASAAADVRKATGQGADSELPELVSGSTNGEDINDEKVETNKEQTEQREKIDTPLDDGVVSTIVGLEAPPVEKQNVYCSKCKNEVSPFRAQLTGKSSGSWKCNICNARIVQLYRAFGTWPPAEFQLLSGIEQSDFYKTAGVCQNAAQVVEKAKLTLTKILVKKHLLSSGGAYLPLSVYAARGFNTKDIEEKCTDTQMHPVLGQTYRVAVSEKTDVTETATEAVQKLLVEGKQRKKAMASNETLQKTIKDTRCKRSQRNNSSKNRKRKRVSSSLPPSSCSASSSCSSADDSDPTARKPKDDKMKDDKMKDGKMKDGTMKDTAQKAMHKKLREKAANDARKKEDEAAKKKDRDAARQRDVAEKKEYRRVQTEATKTLARASPLVASLQKVLNDDLVANFPAANSKSAKKLFETLTAYEAEARDVLSGARTSMTFEQKTFDACCMTGKKELLLMEGLLTTFRKHG